jgi:predicted small lipoprotein YifL
MIRMSARSLLSGGPLLALFALAALLAGCGDDGEDSFSGDDRSTTTTAKEKTTTTEAEDTSPVKDDSASADQSDAEPWARTAQDLRKEVGSTVEFDCPPDGTGGSVWGVNVYTDDSSVCTAAVQVGLISFEEGGTVTIEVLEGQDVYEGGEANGVVSSRYGSWGGSFAFPDAEKLDIGSTVDWGTTARDFKGGDSMTFTVTCPPGVAPGSLWGTGVYTEDSSICTAAVHSGVITLDAGGTVTFTLLPGQDSYEGTEANGVSSGDWGTFGGSFRIDS